MTTVLKNVLPFSGLVVGVPTSLPHLLNVNTVPVIPDLIGASAGGFTITANATNVTVTRTTGGAAVNVYVERWHTIEDCEPPGGLDGLVPFVIESSVGAGASGPPNALAYFDAGGNLVGNAAVWFIDSATNNFFVGGLNGVSELFINQVGALNGSNAGIQHSDIVANRANYRANQWGSNTGIPGVTGFKSRGVAIGTLAAVLVGDVIWRATAIGVCGDNATIPLSGLLSINVDQVAANFLGTSFEVQLVPPTGPINGRKQAFRVDGVGILHLTEAANKSAGVAILDVTGTAVIANTSVSATTKFHLTAQDTGPAPTGSMYQSARVVGTNFTIKSTAGAADAGVQVYYTLFEPTVP